MEKVEKAAPVPVEDKRRKFLRHAVGIFCIILSGVLLALTLVASWAPESQMEKLRWIPDWLAAFADRDPDFRTAIPFIPLMFFLVSGFYRIRVKRPIVWSVAVGGLCLCLAEFGQRFLPHRTADVKDLLWGGVGIVVGLMVGSLSVKVWTLLKSWEK